MVDPYGRLVGVVSREALDSVPGAERGDAPGRHGDGARRRPSGLRAGLEDPLESLLTPGGAARLGAVMAVDGDGVLRGIVTIDAVRRALRGPPCRREHRDFP